MMLASIVLPSPTSSARIARPPICRSTRWATSIWCGSSLMACPPSVMSRSKPGTSATCSASRRSSYQARGAEGASSCLANSSNERSSTDQTGTAGSGISSNQRRGAANIQFANARRQPPHPEGQALACENPKAGEHCSPAFWEPTSRSVDQLERPRIRAHAVGAVAGASRRRSAARSGGAEHERVAAFRDGPSVNHDADRRTTAATATVAAAAALPAVATIAARADRWCVPRCTDSADATLAGNGTEGAITTPVAAVRLDRIVRDLERRGDGEDSKGTDTAAAGSAAATAAAGATAAATVTATVFSQDRVDATAATTAAATTARLAIPPVESIRWLI